LDQVAPVANSALVDEWRDAYNLGAGELSTIILARELTASVALIDERRARRLAAAEGLAVSGSIAVLESGYRKKYVSDLRAAYQQLLAANIWIDQKKLNQKSRQLWRLSIVEATRPSSWLHRKSAWCASFLRNPPNTANSSNPRRAVRFS